MGVFTRTGGTAFMFTAMGGTYEFTKYASANLREKDDTYNSAIGGFLAGSVLGLRFGTTPAVLGFGALTAVVLSAFNYTGGTLGGYKRGPNEDEFERKEHLRRNRRIPVEQTLAELGEGRGIYGPGYDERRRERIKERYGIDDVKERFYRHFQEEVTDLQERIGQLTNLSLAGGERQDATDHCLASITRLSNEVADANDYLPAYDQRTYSQASIYLSVVSIADAAQLAQKSLGATNLKPSLLSSTESSMATTPANLMTPPGEDSARDTVGTYLPSQRTTIPKWPMPQVQFESLVFSEACTINITGHNGLHIILPCSASRATSSGAITELNRCIVDIILRDGSVENQWDQVDDFKWLKVEHSPNWSILPEEERLKEEIWTDVVPGGSGGWA
ncbi:hypothetical protein DID88_002456 [Monilinia fructigena]|uniref:Uncharacterized protein n=1 Tax=Monilinia fructigena TaxID=38457 RepID=A0A395INV3_9HELO|nr:hypothetical protein DID88_002456 [Monilinia fructigena]